MKSRNIALSAAALVLIVVSWPRNSGVQEVGPTPVVEIDRVGS